MAQVKWTERAIGDLIEIAEYINAESPRYAALTVTEIYYSTERLLQFPLSGRMVPEFKSKDVREMIAGNFRIVYSYGDNVCKILTVLHSKRDIQKAF